MFDSSVIDIGIGLVFMYLLLSTAVTAAKEGAEAMFKRRGKDLEKGIKELIGYAASETDDKNSAPSKFIALLYDHPLINSLFVGNYSDNKKGNLPSYIPSKNFALALLDLHNQSASQDAAGTQPEVLPAKVQQAFAAFKMTAGDDKDKLVKQIEDWFDSSMDRVSGWYKRRAQWWIFGIALVLTIAVNADSVLIAKRLSSDKTLREAAVTAARNEAKDSPASTADPSTRESSSGGNSIDTIKAKLTALDGVGFPIGWQADVKQWKKENHLDSWGDKFNFAVSTYGHLPGWIITVLAISLGAPFWFDVLNKFMVVRSTVKPHEKSREERSKDPSQQR